jgi:branched-chain amino acid transport system substrate-binding protein
MRLRIFTVGILLLLTASCKKENTGSSGDTVVLGAILDLSGDYSEEGLAGKAAIGLAIDDLNRRYESVGSPVRFECNYVDTHLDTVLTLDAAGEMYDQGIRLLVAGPNNSAGLQAISAFINEHRMLALTCFSSSPSLAIANDYIFRLITDDNVQGQALIRMMQYDSIRALVPIWREDTYGAGLYETVKQKLTDAGGTVLQGASYLPGTTNYQETIQLAGQQVSTAIATYGAGHVAVILISYQEALGFMQAAAAVDDMAKVRWYGCDANGQKAVISSDPVAGPFANHVRFLAPIMGIGTAGNLPATAQDLDNQIFALTGFHATAYSLTAYDAVEIYGLAYDLVQTYDATKIKTVIPSICESYNYLGISRKLNAAGDLATANYIFWTVVPDDGGYSWDSYATYVADGDYIVLR